MQAMMTFVEWFIEDFPAFLMEEPIIYFVGIIILGYLIKLIVGLKGRY